MSCSSDKKRFALDCSLVNLVTHRRQIRIQKQTVQIRVLFLKMAAAVESKKTMLVSIVVDLNAIRNVHQLETETMNMVPGT